MKPIVHFQDLRNLSYQEAWDYQSSLHKKLVDRKLENRTLIEDGKTAKTQEHYLLFCEHPPVYTLGKSGSMENLLISEEELEAQNIGFLRLIAVEISPFTV